MASLLAKTGGDDRTQAGVEVQALEPDLRVGTTLAGYAIEALVGRGGMGVVYRAEHLHLRRTVALKLLTPELARSGTFRERFVQESQVAAAIRHPNIVTVYDAGEAEGLLYIAMQYVDGTDLAEVLGREGPLEPERALLFIGQVAEALDEAHARGLVHRDVKPGNVLIDSQRCYLSDFGLTRQLDSTSALTTVGQFVGTIDYMAPEQIAGGTLDGRADVYALGCLLFHVLTGAPPHARDTQIASIYAHLAEPPPSVEDRCPGLGASLDPVLSKALAKERADRYPTCTELVAAAWSALGNGPPGADRPPATPSAPKLRVLIADRDSGVRALIGVSLDRSRFEVVEAGDSASALAASHEAPLDLVFAGWTMPDAPAGELVRRLRQGTERPKIVALTSRADGVEPGAGQAAGADDCLRKPFSAIQVLYTVATLLGAEVVSP